MAWPCPAVTKRGLIELRRAATVKFNNLRGDRGGGVDREQRHPAVDPPGGADRLGGGGLA
jgi:hypothetical protein